MSYRAPQTFPATSRGPHSSLKILVCAVALIWAQLAPLAASAAEETNPFSNTKPDPQNEQLHQQMTAMDERMKQMESQVTAIQQVQVAVPAEALNPAGGKAGAAAAVPDDATIELQTATFIACVNGKAMFRDSDQKPFFVGAKEASENDAVRRLGGCKP